MANPYAQAPEPTPEEEGLLMGVAEELRLRYQLSRDLITICWHSKQVSPSVYLALVFLSAACGHLWYFVLLSKFPPLLFISFCLVFLLLTLFGSFLFGSVCFSPPSLALSIPS